MRDFLEDNFDSIIILSLIICGLIISVHYINLSNRERIAIITNNKDNVIKYNKCEHIDNYYYCWNE